MDKAKVKVTMEIEVEDLEAFMTALEPNLIEFSKMTGANILRTEIKEV